MAMTMHLPQHRAFHKLPLRGVLTDKIRCQTIISMNTVIKIKQLQCEIQYLFTNMSFLLSFHITVHQPENLFSLYNTNTAH